MLGLVLAACNSQPMNRAMPPPSQPPHPAAPDLADAGDDATAEAVVWIGERAVVAGSAGSTDATPRRADPIFADGAHYHGWLRAVDARGTAVWTRRFDDGREVHVRAVARLGDDLVVCGEQRAGDARAYTGWLARLGPGGEERWRVDRLGEPGATGLSAIAVRGDGSAVAGGMQAGHGWLVAVDARGKLGWGHKIPELDEITAAMPLGDAVIVAAITGRTTTSAGTSRLIAIDTRGAPQWSTELSEHGAGELYALAPLGDGGVAVGQAPGDSGDGAWVVRFDASGAIRSSQVLAAKGADAARAVAVTADGGYVVAGSSFEAPRRRAAVWRFDASGQLRWQQRYGSDDSFARGIAAAPDGGAVVVGVSQASGGRLRPWLAGIDPLGALRWTAP